MKQKILDQILERCSKIHKEEKDEDVEEKCETYKECQCEEKIKEAFFGTNYVY